MIPTDDEIAGLVVWIQGKRMPHHASAAQELLARAKAAESDLSTAREEIAKVTEERDAAHTDIDTLMQINLDLVQEIEGLRAALEHVGQVGNVCVGRTLGRRCDYCACDGKNLVDGVVSGGVGE